MQDRCLHTAIQERWLHTVCNARQNTWPNPCMWHMRKPSSVPTPPWMESQHRLVLGCRTCSHIRHKCGETLTSSMLRLYHYVWSHAQSVWEIEGMTWPGAAEWREEKTMLPKRWRGSKNLQEPAVLSEMLNMFTGGMLGEGGLYRVRGRVPQEKLRSSW